MMISPVAGFSFSPQNRIKIENKNPNIIRSSNPAGQIKDMVSFGNTQEETMKKAVKMVKLIFNNFTSSNGVTLEENFEHFEQIAGSLSGRVKNELLVLTNSIEFPKIPEIVSESLRTVVQAYEQEGEKFFEKYTAKGKLLSSLRITKGDNSVLFRVLMGDDQPSLRSVYYRFGDYPAWDFFAARIIKYKSDSKKVLTSIQTQGSKDYMFK